MHETVALDSLDPVKYKNNIMQVLILTDTDKTCLLLNRWVATGHYSYPQRDFGGKQLKYNVLWEKKYEWLWYSANEHAAYCVYCLALP